MVNVSVPVISNCLQLLHPTIRALNPCPRGLQPAGTPRFSSTTTPKNSQFSAEMTRFSTTTVPLLISSVPYRVVQPLAIPNEGS